MSNQAQSEQGMAERYASEVIGYACPFCGTVYSTSRSNCDGGDLACCGEVGHCEPYTKEQEDADGQY